MARSKTYFRPMRSKKSGKKTNKRIQENHILLKKLTNGN